MDRPAVHDEAGRNLHPIRYGLVAGVLLCAGAAAHLWYLIHDCPLDLSGDEAHYWEWARRLDWSYYSKGPLVAYIIAGSRWLLAGWSERVVGNEALAVRSPAILLSLGTGLGLYTLTWQTLRAPRLALAAVALTFTIPILAVGAVLMTIDAPLAFCYVWALVAVQCGLRTRHLLPWMLGLVPILAWNAQHHWVSFRHVAGQAGVTGGHALDLLGPFSFLAGQFAVIGPIWFACLLCAVIAVWRSPHPEPSERHEVPALRLLLCASVTPWLVFLAFSLITKIQPNWPVLALLPGLVVLVGWLARLLRHATTRRMARGVIAAGVILGGVSVVMLHFTQWVMPALAWMARREPPWNLTPVAKYDPTARLRGWSELGRAVGRAERLVAPGAFIITDDYQTASEIAFYCPGEPQVYCLQAALGDRQSQYDIWSNPIRHPELFVGRPCIYVGALKPGLIGQGGFRHVALPGVRLAETVEHRVRGQLLRVWPVYVCDGFAGLPPELSRAFQRF
jgi:hypothetical protein